MSEDNLEVFYCYYVPYVVTRPDRDKFGACLYYFAEEINGETDLISIQRDILSKAKEKDDNVENVIILNLVSFGLRSKPSV